MARLIDADAIIDFIDMGRTRNPLENCFSERDVVDMLESAPTVDAVEVVRCQYCKYYEIHKPKVLENCERNGYLIPMKPNDFCSYGERKNEVNE